MLGKDGKESTKTAAYTYDLLGRIKKANTIFACNYRTGGCGRKENNKSQRNPTEKPTQTGEPAQTEKPAESAPPTMSEEKTEGKNEKGKKRKIKSVTVIDETGKKRKLRLGALNETDVGGGFCSSDFSEGSQFSDVQWKPGGEYEPGAFLISRNLDNVDQENKMTCTEQMNEAKPYLTFVDGKILYGRQKGKVVFLYMYDLETREQTELLRFKRKKAYIRYSTLSNDSVLLSVDDDYIYCQDMAIPRKGGKIQPLLKNAMRHKYGGGTVLFSSNKKYIFYLDKKYHLHRINKESGEDILVSKKKLMSVECMEDRIYVKAWRYGYWDEDEEKRPDILYCMDLNGKIKWKHTMEKQPEEDDGYLGDSE